MSKFLYAFDLSMSNTGVTIFDLENMRHIQTFHIDTSKVKSEVNSDKLTIHAPKLRLIRETLINKMEEFEPHIVVIESIFAGGANVTNTLPPLAKVHGVIQELFADFAQTYYSPVSVKNICGWTTAKKDDIIRIVNLLFRLSFINDNEADSFLLVIKYLVDNNLISLTSKIDKGYGLYLKGEVVAKKTKKEV